MRIIYEDEDLLVFDKSPGINSDNIERRIHRLDKDTSGVLLVAKTPEAFGALKRQFQERETLKEYLALVHGKVTPDEGEIEAPIDRSPFNPRHFGVFPGGRQATTKYKVRERFKFDKEDLTLLEVFPKTGRTHQIRVHLKYINHPIVADPIYGGRKNGQWDKKWCPRLFLHARRLSVKHPTSGEIVNFEASLPAELETTLGLLR